ncbi:unnamed protein product [Arabis nemorensis]|uniref:Uncharacterized protein n=1 Tax=Arabis nemorensis TaxID=586526 RepID=A0A565BCS8_9BRAS|nr:unnamed protein product [Arabis nemorensis]
MLRQRSLLRAWKQAGDQPQYLRHLPDVASFLLGELVLKLSGSINSVADRSFDTVGSGSDSLFNTVRRRLNKETESRVGRASFVYADQL